MSFRAFSGLMQKVCRFPVPFCCRKTRLTTSTEQKCCLVGKALCAVKSKSELPPVMTLSSFFISVFSFLSFAYRKESVK